MSIEVRRDDIDGEQTQWLTNFLTMKPQLDNKNDVPPPPFPFYSSTIRSNTKMVRLPFLFGLTYCKRNRMNINEWRYSKDNKLYGWSRDNPDLRRCNVEFRYISTDPTTQQENILRGEEPLRESQVGVVREAFHNLVTTRATTIGAYPGFGKTICGAYLSSRLGFITLIFIHRKTLITQWVKTYSVFTNAVIWVVGMGVRILNGQIIKDLGNIIPDVIICMDQRIDDVPPNILDRVGTLIIDEAHCFCTPTRVMSILNVTPSFIILETATPNKLNGLHNVLHLLAGTSVIVRKRPDPFDVYCIKTGIHPKRENTRNGRPNWSIFQQSLIECNGRNLYALHLILRNIKSKILILTLQVNHAIHLKNIIKSVGIGCDYMCGSKMKYFNSKVLIGTVSKIGTGFDEATFCDDYDGVTIDMLIMMTSYKDPNVIEQAFGRVFRAKNPVIYYLLDNDKLSTKHWHSAYGVLKGYEATIHRSEANLYDNWNEIFDDVDEKISREITLRGNSKKAKQYNIDLGDDDDEEEVNII